MVRWCRLATLIGTQLFECDLMTTDIQRLVEFDFLRATEIAALNSMQWIGKGNKEAADEAACDAIRGMMDITDICGTVVIGEGSKTTRRVFLKARS